MDVDAAHATADHIRTGLSDEIGARARRLRNHRNRAHSRQGPLGGLGKEAFIEAHSGYGKTVLANSLLQKALEALHEPLPFLVPIDELEQLQQSPLDYCQARLKAHCPQFRSRDASIWCAREAFSFCLMVSTGFRTALARSCSRD